MPRAKKATPAAPPTPLICDGCGREFAVSGKAPPAWDTSNPDTKFCPECKANRRERPE